MNILACAASTHDTTLEHIKRSNGYDVCVCTRHYVAPGVLNGKEVPEVVLHTEYNGY